MCHDLLVAYILYKPGGTNLLAVDKLVDLIKFDAQVDELQRFDRTPDVEKLGREQGLVFAALINATSDILADMSRSAADKTAAIAAVTSLVSGSVSAGSGFIPAPGVAAPFSKTADTLMSALFDRATARYTRKQTALREAINEIDIRFNILVLGQANSGVIAGLDSESPPSDPDLIPLLVPTAAGYPVCCRPTSYDIQLYKEAACNTVLILCSSAGVFRTARRSP